MNKRAFPTTSKFFDYTPERVTEDIVLLRLTQLYITDCRSRVHQFWLMVVGEPFTGEQLLYHVRTYVDVKLPIAQFAILTSKS